MNLIQRGPLLVGCLESDQQVFIPLLYHTFDDIPFVSETPDVFRLKTLRNVYVETAAEVVDAILELDLFHPGRGLF